MILTRLTALEPLPKLRKVYQKRLPETAKLLTLMQTEFPVSIWRLVKTEPANGAWNMAVDEAILEAVAARLAPATLRLYAWEPACLSLGRAQLFSDVDTSLIQSAGVDLVRRITGGRAILHADELTYSITAPGAEPRVAGDIPTSYKLLSAGLLQALQLLGANATNSHHATQRASAGAVCFEVPSKYEITSGERKLIGSAQVRRRNVVLQHGTLPLTGNIARICELLPFAGPQERTAAAERVRSRACTLATALGRETSWDTAAEALAAGFCRALNLVLELQPLSAQEIARAQALVQEKYATAAWNENLRPRPPI